MMSEDIERNQWLSELITDGLPRIGVTSCFAYGSKIFKQINNRFGSNDMIDFIIVVDNPFEWHQENYQRNSKHYSAIRYFPNNINLIVDIQERYGAQIYYNPYVTMKNQLVKYGVIKTEHLIDDLQNWTTLYVAGRLHKPVLFLADTLDGNKQLQTGILSNRECAISAALMQLPENFKSIDLYRTIAGLSYSGDYRMIFGENKNKVENIVQAQMPHFDHMYLSSLKRRDNVIWNEARGSFCQDLNPLTLLKNLETLPQNVRNNICKIHSSKARSIESNAILTSVSKSLTCDKIVAQAISAIVKRSSLSQSLKGLISAGLLKSIKYSQKKILKSIDSRLR